MPCQQVFNGSRGLCCEATLRVDRASVYNFEDFAHSQTEDPSSTSEFTVSGQERLTSLELLCTV